MFRRSPLPARELLLAACASWMASHAGPAAAAPPQAAEVTCTNPYSHASWQIRIDYARGTVDDYPAQFTAALIRWHDRRDGGHYSLDRRTGALTARFASSTGGYFLHDTCDLGRPRSPTGGA